MTIPFRFPVFQAAVSPDGHTSGEHGDDAGAAEPVVAGGRRSCGACSACCICLPIKAGDVCRSAKPAGVRCPHLAASGCEVYCVRSTTCRQFQCVWLGDKSWPMEWRPERSGLLCLREEIHEGVSAAAVYEVEPGAFRRLTTPPILTRLKESTAFVVLVNAQQQRQLIRGYRRLEPGDRLVARPHFVKSIDMAAGRTEDTEALRDAS